jgi:hypothetical protein
MATRESMSDDEFGAKLCKAYDEYEEHREAGRLDDDAPGAHEIVNQLMRANREAREAREAAATGGVAGKQIEKKGRDDEQPEKTAGGNNGNGSGPMPARDSKPRWGRPHPLEHVVKGYGRLG